MTVSKDELRFEEEGDDGEALRVGGALDGNEPLPWLHVVGAHGQTPRPRGPELRAELGGEVLRHSLVVEVHLSSQRVEGRGIELREKDRHAFLGECGGEHKGSQTTAGNRRLFGFQGLALPNLIESNPIDGYFCALLLGECFSNSSFVSLVPPNLWNGS